MLGNYYLFLISDHLLRPWIGGLQVTGPEPKGGWRFVPDLTKDIYDYYHNFAFGEPNNSGGPGGPAKAVFENCLQMRNDNISSKIGQWNDESCGFKFAYICSQPASQTWELY